MPSDVPDLETVLDAVRRESDKWQQRAERAENLAGSVITTSLTAVVLGVTGFGIAQGEGFSDNPYADWAPRAFVAALVVLLFAVLWATSARAPALIGTLMRLTRSSPRLRAHFEELNSLVLPTQPSEEGKATITRELLAREYSLCEARHATARAQEGVADLAQNGLALAIVLLGLAGFFLVWPSPGG